MKKILSILFYLLPLCIFATNNDEFNHHFQINRYRYGDYSTNNFNEKYISGSGYISIDRNDNATIILSYNGTQKSFILNSNDILDVESNENELKITYRYSNSRVNIEIAKTGITIAQFIGKRFYIWYESEF